MQLDERDLDYIELCSRTLHFYNELDVIEGIKRHDIPGNEDNTKYSFIVLGVQLRTMKANILAIKERTRTCGILITHYIQDAESCLFSIDTILSKLSEKK